MMKTSFLLVVLLCMVACGVPGEGAKPTDQENIQGVWLAQTESQNGTQWNVSYVYEFSGDKITFRDETGQEITYSFRLDTTGDLKFIVLQPVGAPDNSTPVSVAYELDGDSLKIVVAPPGLRPTELSDKNDQELIICKRKGS